VLRKGRMRKRFLVLVACMAVLAGGAVSIEARAECVGDDCSGLQDQPLSGMQVPLAPVPSTIGPPTLPIVTPLGEPISNSCALAFNDVCDEPEPCTPGTDGHDCAMRTGE
jgi:hypothetical protein